MKKTLHFVVLCFFASYLQAQTPGVSTYYQQTTGDTRNYIEYIPGNLPIIISAPHGGVQQSGQTIGGIFYPDNDSSLPDRNCGTNERDDNTDILVREIQKEIYQLTGCYAHVIINNLHRSKLDPNREINEATCGNNNAADHWNAFHNFIDQASASVEANWGKGLYIDLHGQSHSIPRIEAGYNVTANELNIGNLNASDIIDKSTIRNLVSNNLNGLTHEELIRGNTSLGEMFQNVPSTFYASLGHAGCGSTNGYRTVPSATSNGILECDDTRPYTNAYFDGDFYNNRRHGSGNGTVNGVGGAGRIDGIMTEVNRRVRDLGTYNGQVYDSRPQTLVPFAKDYAAVVLNFIDTHYNDFANFSYLATTYAINGSNPSPVITGVANGIFSAPAGITVNPTTGEIDVANSLPGTYEIFYTVGTCGYYKSSQTISIVNDISQDSQPPTAPVNLVASNTTQTTTDLSWTASSDNVNVAGYHLYQNGNFREALSQNTNFVVSNLTPNTTYTFAVTAIDAAGNESTSSNEITVVTSQNILFTYCSSASSNVSDEYISNVQLADIDNASGAQFYSDFTSISTNLTKNAPYTITVTPTWTGTVYSEGYAAWIDYNQDGDFDDPGEQIWSQAATQTTPVNGNFTVPTSAPNGFTRMRVAMKYGGIPSPCEAFTYGEVEDYTVHIISAAPDTLAPVITLLGDNPVTIPLNTTYTDAGATALDNIDGDISDMIQVSGSVNTAVEGTYTLFYNVSDVAGNEATQVTRTIHVIIPIDEIAPVISLNGNSIIDLNVGDTYIEAGATATDNVDGDISNQITISGNVDTSVAGTYFVRYNVNDAAGNAATEVVRTINVLSDTSIPVISLNGSETITLNVGDTYIEAGATATDNVDGDISNQITISGIVDTSVAGTYFVRYNVNDAAGNAAVEIIRTIFVNEISNCPNGITIFPYTESFENTLGGWTQATQDDLDWTLNTNGTQSNGTGPESANNGNYYLYVEASGNGTGYPTKQAILTSPCIDFTATTEATFSFDYHMYGIDVGSLAVEMSEDNGNSWTEIWSQTGNQGSSWLTATVDISSFTGNTVLVRFNRISATTWRADVAIDHVRITNEAVVVEGCTNGITAFPYAESYENTLADWTQSTQDDTDWTINSNTTQSNNTGPSAAIDGNYYVYVEASGNGTGYPNKRAILNSPCYDLTNESSAEFSFSYHMFGSNDMGTISLEASTDNGLFWETIWSESGNKGDQWFNVNLNISQYIGESVQLRFNRVTGGTWQADVAIDHVRFNSSLMARHETQTNKDVSQNNDVNLPNSNMLTVYPNPVRGNVLHVKLQSGTIQSYKIYAVHGQLVATGTTENTIQVNKLPSGMYFLEIFDGKETFTKKFIKK